MMSGANLDIKDQVEQKDFFDRYGRYDIVYVMLDKRIDHLSDEIKDVKSEIKDVRGEIKDVRGEIKELRVELFGEIKKTNQRIDGTNQRIDGLFLQMVSMKMWGIGLAVTIILAIVGLAVPVIISLLR